MKITFRLHHSSFIIQKMHGVLNVLKPPGLTSHDVVGIVRRVVGTKRVGHTGTLDPAAAGVLPICLGQATRLVEYLQAGTKAYTAEITFGYETDTLDAEGKVLYTSDAAHIDLENLRHALDAFRGEIEQTPPLYSALKKDGKKLYELAREGVEGVEIPTRRVTISYLWVSRFVPSDGSTLPRAILKIECSGGTYIRSLIRDIGHALGTFATMTFLVRTHNGAFNLDEAQTLEQIEAHWQSTLIPLTQVLVWCARLVIVDDAAINCLAQGKILDEAETARAVKAEFARNKPERYAEHIGRAMPRGTANQHKAVFFNSQRTIAAIAEAIQDTAPISYKPEKVFFLDRD